MLLTNPGEDATQDAFLYAAGDSAPIPPEIAESGERFSCCICPPSSASLSRGVFCEDHVRKRLLGIAVR